MQLAAPSQDAAPPARSVRRQTRGRAPRRSARSPWPPVRADRAAPSARHARSPAPTARQAMLVASTPATRSSLRGAFQHRLGQLLDKERHPVGALDDLGDDLGGERGIAGQLLHQRLAVAFAEPIERQARDVGAAAPGRLKFGAKGDRRAAPAAAEPGRGQIRATRARSGRSSGRPRTPSAPAGCLATASS